MHAKVRKPFLYAHDGFTVRPLSEGDVLDIDDLVAPGLEAAGLIEAADDDEIRAAAPVEVIAQPPVEIPPDWRELGAAQLKALAGEFSHPAAANKAAAIAVIEAELARREAA